MVEWNEERCDRICIILSSLLEGKSATPEAGRNVTTVRNTSVEMRQYIYGFCNSFFLNNGKDIIPFG